MSQPTPDISEEDVERILRRDYSHANLGELRASIGRLDLREKWRVAVACMKNAGGDVQKLQGELAAAEADYRDVLSEAEYPEATRKWFRIEKFSEAERQAIYDRDWRQYEEWLRRR